MSRTAYIEPLDKPLYLMAKPVGAACNLRCDYCYYLEKSQLYASRRCQMSDEMLELYIRNYIECQPSAEVQFCWHGGEPILRGLDFFRRAMVLQRKYAKGRRIDNSLQTNGTLLTDEWCRFLKDYDFLVGISIDGPEHCHDHYRHAAGGGGSFKQVMRGVNLLLKHDVPFNTMSVINSYNADYADEVYHFLKQIGGHYMQFSPVVERLSGVREDGLHLLPAEQQTTAELAPWSVDPIQMGNFYIQIFDEWVRHDVGRYFVQLFDSALACHVGMLPSSCIFAPTCGHAAAMEFNGDVYSCDHYVYPEHRIGNLHQLSFWQMMNDSRQQTFGQNKRDKLPPQCRACDVLHLCNGECPKNRIDADRDGYEGLNYLCRGYYAFFRHALPALDFMASELRAQRSPANVMRWMSDNDKKS
ncbi:MAG: anaerobic sulfatase-maturation protein [Paludibacteraceae bacterium]|nr:anaerobic sulfatase-maturation protein [Paludibacteraceae bacterium]